MEKDIKVDKVVHLTNIHELEDKSDIKVSNFVNKRVQKFVKDMKKALEKMDYQIVLQINAKITKKE